MLVWGGPAAGSEGIRQVRSLNASFLWLLMSKYQTALQFTRAPISSRRRKSTCCTLRSKIISNKMERPYLSSGFYIDEKLPWAFTNIVCAFIVFFYIAIKFMMSRQFLWGSETALCLSVLFTVEWSPKRDFCCICLSARSKWALGSAGGVRTEGFTLPFGFPLPCWDWCVVGGHRWDSSALDQHCFLLWGCACAWTCDWFCPDDG